jgi:RNase adaptor protein for sRNA GlmZ degradation
VPSYEDLVVALSAVHIHDRKRHRVSEVAGHLIVYLLKEKCDKLSKTQLQELLKASTDRLWDKYQNKRKDKSLLAQDAALQAINAEIEFLTKEFNLKP